MPHVFISYVREDTTDVERLCDALRSNGIKFWIDRYNILPGSRWKQAIRKAIKDGDSFIACFSPNYIKRNTTYMNEELTLAIEILRQKPVDRVWFIPVLLSECTVPEREIGGGETLLDLQQVRLYENWDAGIDRIVSVARTETTGSHPTSGDDAAETKAIKILFLVSDPSMGQRLRVDHEVREIQSEIMGSTLRDRFEIALRWTVGPSDLQRALLEVRPNIVHFIGHGAREGTLVFEDDSGKTRLISANAFARALELAAPELGCVVLNFSHSSELAKTLGKQVRHVISMKAGMGDRAAIIFARRFYGALAHGCTIVEAFQLACTSIELYMEQGTPELIVNEQAQDTMRRDEL